MQAGQKGSNGDISRFPRQKSEGSDGKSSPRRFSISILFVPENDLPTPIADKVTVTRGVPLTLPVLSNDSDLDGDPLTIAAVDGPAHD
jgi:large repetitive protein